MRISITGAAGIGKTTLAHALAERFALPVLAEDFKEIVLAFNTPLSSAAGGVVLLQRRGACLRWLERREALYLTHADFVEDRCSVDILIRWLIANLSDSNNQETLAFVQRIGLLLDKTDYLVIPPFTPFNEVANTAGLVRAGSLSRLFRAQALGLGIAQMLVNPAKLIFLGTDCRSVEARVAFIAKRIDHERRPRPLP